MTDDAIMEASDPAVLDGRLSRRLAQWSLGAGLCAFIPIPFIDDWANARVRSAMAATLLRGADVALTKPQHKHLLHGAPGRKGCLRRLLSIPKWIAKWLIWYPIKKLLRKILIIFTIHDAVNAISYAFHHGYLLHVALADGWRPQADEDPARLHDCIETVCRTAESRPVIKLIRLALTKGRHAFRRESLRLYRRLRRTRGLADATDEVEASVNAESDALGDVATSLADTFMTQRGYFNALGCELRNRLAKQNEETQCSEPPPLPR